MRTLAFGLIAAIGLLPQPASAQEHAVGAVPVTGQAPSYSIDLTRYFATPQIEAAELKQRMDEAASFPTTAPDEPQALAGYLHRAESLLAQLERHNAYLHLRASRNIDDRADADADERTSDAMDRLVTTVGAALRSLGDSTFARDVSAYPALKRYAYLLARATRDLPHELPREQQAIISELADPASANLWTVYRQTVLSTPFAKVSTAEGEFDARKDARLLAVDPDRTVREAAWRGRWEGYASRADVYSSILMGVVRLNDRVARLQHFPDAPSKVYFKKGLDRKNVTEALAQVEHHAELLKDYQRMRMQHIAALSGIDGLRAWDWSLPVPGFPTPRMTLDQARVELPAALAPLGHDYVEQFRRLLDPANGRIDIALEQGKRTNGGFSIGAPGVPSGLFVENYGHGLLADSRIIVHEGGHAIHKELMNESGVSPFYTTGPNWMFEAFAILNEYLLYDHLYQTSTDPRTRAYYLEALIDDMTVQIFTSAEEATLEQSIYDGVIADRIKNAADLNALTLSIWSKYEIWPASEPEFAYVWTTKSLMYQDPLYLVNYLYAGLLATKMFDMVGQDPSSFRKRYAALLHDGFHAPPDTLLRIFFGRDLSQQELVEDGMKVLQQRMAALAEIYPKLDPKH